MLERALQSQGWKVTIAGNGQQALQILNDQKNEFFLLIIDIKMPVMNGLDFLQQAHKKYPILEFLILTADASVDTVQEAFKYGATKFYTKPLSNSELEFITRKANQLYSIREQSLLFLQRYTQKEIQDLAIKENQLLTEVLTQEFIKLENQYTELLQFVRKNQSKLEVPPAIRVLLDNGTDYQEL